MAKFKASNGYLVAGGTIRQKVEYARSDAKGEQVNSVTWPALLALVEYAATLGLTADASRAAIHQTAEQETSELTDRSLDGRGDEQGRCPATLFINGEHARCAGDRGHTDKHHSERLAAIWSRDTQAVATLTPAGPEWEEFQAWKADKERQRKFHATKAALLAVAVAADERGDMDNTAGVGLAFWKAMKLHEAGTIDLSIYDEGKSE